MRAKLYRPDYRTGYLTYGVNPLTTKVLNVIGVEQVCPDGKTITRELVDDLHAQGFSVRAWGIANEELMRHAVECGVDGMTINFPDKLTAYLANR
jgi:glycerophosphoryl diester phosphodiesterase